MPLCQVAARYDGGQVLVTGSRFQEAWVVMGTGAGRCTVCGGDGFAFRPILWKALIDEWQLAPEEAAYIDRQQGMHCTACGANLRSVALARTILAWAGSTGTLQEWASSAAAAGSAVLEINEAGSLSPMLRLLPGHVLAVYPAVDIHALPYTEGSFDLVIHSDTLEHVAHPVRALSECRRVLRAGGGLCFTVPTVVGRLSRSRAGLPMSFHGDAATSSADWAVQTEFGADAWTYVVMAGFGSVAIHTVDYPSATAMLAVR